MPGITDFEYQQPGPALTPPPTRRRGIAVAIAIAILVIIAGVGYFWLARERAMDAPPQADAGTPAAAPPAPKPTAPVYDLPPLENSDSFMRERIGALSAHPAIATWLKTTDLARNVAVVLENTSRGATPAAHLRVLRPQGSFTVTERDGRTLIDSRSFDRFNGIGAAAASIDPDSAAALYRGIKPLLQSAYDQLGGQERIDAAVERAIEGLLAAPTVEGDIAVVPATKGPGYAFADARLERLTGAQKQLMRMGPANQRAIQERLRRFAAAAGLQRQ